MSIPTDADRVLARDLQTVFTVREWYGAPEPRLEAAAQALANAREAERKAIADRLREIVDARTPFRLKVQNVRALIGELAP